MTGSYMPPVCPICGGVLLRISHTNENLRCYEEEAHTFKLELIKH